MFLLDSDISIFFMKGQAGVKAHFAKYGPATIFLSSVSYHELLYGALRSSAVERHLSAVAAFVAPLTVLPFTSSSADYSSRVRQDLAARGKTIGPLDTLIAGHALEHQLTLVTANPVEFSRVPGLTFVSWI